MPRFHQDDNAPLMDKLDEMIELQKQLLSFFTDMQAKHEDRPSIVDVSGHEVQSDPPAPLADEDEAPARESAEPASPEG